MVNSIATSFTEGLLWTPRPVLLVRLWFLRL
jgi:hypothetical protein